GNFYGTTDTGGAFSANLLNGLGTVYRISPLGQLRVLHSFGGGADGQLPVGGLIQGQDGSFYGITQEGGSTSTGYNSGRGTVFKISPSGVETVLHSFGDGSVQHDGRIAFGELLQLPNGDIYGTTIAGGTTETSQFLGDGTIFKISS